MTKTQQVKQIYAVLDARYPEAHCSLDYNTVYELLFAVRLSAQCTDARVNLVTPVLFAKYKTLEDYANADLSDVEEIVRSTGFYKNKAKSIIEMAQILLAQYDGRVPDSIDELVKLPGVGRKTANLIVGDVYGQPAIIADTHCIRISNRLGLCATTDPGKVEMALRKIVPDELSTRLCHLFVFFGRDVCTARSPMCTRNPEDGVCPLQGGLCKQVMAKK